MTSLFDALDDYLAIPRVGGLALSADGRRLVCAVQTLSTDRKRYASALWEVDPDGHRPARRLTRSADGESAAAFLPDGDLLFVSKRPDPFPDRNPDQQAAGADDVPALWLLPAAGGEARQVAGRPGGIERVLVARDCGVVVLGSSVLPGPVDSDGDRRKARDDAGVTALLHETSPVRYWDHDLGPAQSRLFAAEPSQAASADVEGAPELTYVLRDLTPEPGRGLDEVAAAIAPDGRTIVTGWRVAHRGGRQSKRLVAIDVASGEHRLLLAADETVEGQCDYDEPAVSPDGRLVVCVEERIADVDRCPSFTLVLVELATGERRDLLPGFALWPRTPVFAGDSAAVFFVADEAGHAPVFRVDLDGGRVTRLTASGAHSQLCVAPDGRRLFALRSHVDAPPTPVRLDPITADQRPSELTAPGRLAGDALPGRVEDVEAVAADGARVRGWLLLPETASPSRPAPLALWVHGGPMMSWQGWSWRWNPWLLVARGWAVLLPDPALSQGYGDSFIQRGWGWWGPVPFADLMAVTDAVVARDDVDAERTAMMGGSYGGYMANWIAGHTTRFKAIVSHASLWSVDAFTGATDVPWAWEQEWGHPLDRPERFERDSPHRHAAAIRTPMLVVHGDKDYRVPIGEGLRLWSELVRRGVPAKFLYFPDEGHWVLKPGNAKVWYETVFAFLDHHVLGAAWTRPELV